MAALELSREGFVRQEYWNDHINSFKYELMEKCGELVVDRITQQEITKIIKKEEGERQKVIEESYKMQPDGRMACDSKDVMVGYLKIYMTAALDPEVTGFIRQEYWHDIINNFKYELMTS
jgi:hypothetical protein